MQETAAASFEPIAIKLVRKAPAIPARVSLGFGMCLVPPAAALEIPRCSDAYQPGAEPINGGLFSLVTNCGCPAKGRIYRREDDRKRARLKCVDHFLSQAPYKCRTRR